MSTLDILMGVVYKLKQEIIDFIIEQKKIDPSLSCRKLVKVVQQQHQVELSKSSVNALIREFNLSSPVGRKPKFKAPKNFYIPQDKKEAIREQLKPFLPDISIKPVTVSEQGEAVPETTVPIELTQTSAGPVMGAATDPISAEVPDPKLGISESEVAGSQKTNVPSFNVSAFSETVSELPRENDQALSLLPDPVAVVRSSQDDARKVEEAVRQQPHFSRIWGIDDGPLLDGVGGIFLLALLWEMDPEGSLGKLIADACGIAVDSVAAKAVEVVLILDAFSGGLSMEEQVTVPSGIAAILGFSEAEAVTLFTDIRNKKVADARLRMAAASAFAAASFEVACFEFTTDKGGKFYTDPLLGTLMREPDLTRSRVPLHFALKRLADRFVNNVEPCVFGLFPGHDLADPFVWERLATMSGQTDDPVLSVAVLSSQGEKVAGFDRVPNIKRDIMAVGSLTDTDMQRISFEMIQDGQVVFEPVLELSGSVIEGQIVDGDKKAYSVIVLSEEVQKQKFLILYNINKKINNIENFIRFSALSKPLYCIKDHKIKTINPQNAISVDISGNIKPLSHVSSEYSKYLEQRLLERYESLCLDQQTIDLKTLFYSIKGYVKDHPLGLLLKLALPSDHPQPETVRRAVAALNARFLTDRRGVRVVVCCEQLPVPAVLQ